MIKAVIFDMDGLLFDTERVFDIVWAEVAKEHGFLLEQKMLDNLRGTSGQGMANIIESYWPTVNGIQIIDELFSRARKILKENVPLKPGAKELVRFLWEHKIPMAVASGSLRDLVLNNLEVVNLKNYFDVIVSGDEVSKGKPAPDIFLLAAQRLNQNPQDCLVLEDGVHGVLAGLSAKCVTYMVPDKLLPTKEIIEYKVPIYKSLSEVQVHLQKLLLQ